MTAKFYQNRIKIVAVGVFTDRMTESVLRYSNGTDKI